MKNLLCILLGLIVSPLALSAVPHTFTAGTPARASDVNENFEALDANTSKLKADLCQISPGYNGIGILNRWINKPLQISYTAKGSYVGQPVTINGVKYRIVDVPIKEFKTGKLYRLRLPLRSVSGESGGTCSNEKPCVGMRYEAHHISQSLECSNITVSGFPARLISGQFREVRFRNNGGGKSSSYQRVSAFISIRIGDTGITIWLGVGKTETEHLVNVGDYNFVDDFDTQAMTNDESSVRTIDDLIDYVQIEEVQ